jgi:hypothetical protein
MKVHFVYSKDTENSGDLSCGYYAYFGEMFKKYPIVIWDIGTIDFSLVAKNDVVIVGGGGLLDNSDLWNYNINRLAKKCRYCFLFAPGFNRHYGHRVSVMLKTGAFRQWTVRDYHHPAGGRYVPCASCLRPEFSMTYPVVRKYGVVKHFQFDMSREFNLPQITNDRPLHELLAFIGSSEIIVSNTYHAVYWAVLMKKKVILDAPFSEKFKYLKYPPVLFSGDLEKDAAQAVVYENALTEAQELVRNFAEDILRDCPTKAAGSFRRKAVKILCLLVPVKKWRKLLRLRFH